PADPASSCEQPPDLDAVTVRHAPRPGVQNGADMSGRAHRNPFLPPPIAADIVTESGASRVSPLPGRGWPLTAWAWPRACAIVHQDVRPSGCTACLISPRHPRPPGADQRTVARYPTRAPGGTAAGPAASPERQDAHARGGACEPAAPLGAGGPARRPAARRAARPWRGTGGRSWPAPRQRLPAGLGGRRWLSHCRSGENCPEIHPQQDEHPPSGRYLTNAPCLVETGTTFCESPRRGGDRSSHLARLRRRGRLPSARQNGGYLRTGRGPAPVTEHDPLWASHATCRIGAPGRRVVAAVSGRRFPVLCARPLGGR